MVADDLATQGARNSPASAIEGLIKGLDIIIISFMNEMI